MMALSKPKSVDLSVGLTNRYFYMVFQKYGITVPEDASWKEMDEISQLNDHARIFQEVPNMLFEMAHMLKSARVEELVKKCERLCLNSGNLYSQFTKTISTLLDNGITWGKAVIFFSFAVSFAIYLCTNEMSHLAGKVSVWMAQDIQSRIQPWIDVNGGWVSNDACTLSLSESYRVDMQLYHCIPQLNLEGMNTVCNLKMWSFIISYLCTCDKLRVISS